MSEVRVTLPGSVRSKKNSKRIFARGRFKKVLPSKAYEAWESQARRSLIPRFPLEKIATSVHVEAHFYYKGPQPDLSGCMESVADAMQGLLWLDDRQIVSWDGSRLHHDLNNPRTELIVRW